MAAIVGQKELKRALMLAAVNPLIGGVLIRGEKGTAKSTAARGLSELLPPVETPYGLKSAPFRTLPLGATEDRVAGGLDLSEALARGRRLLSEGLLSEASGGVLYIDEVNLLDDHLVDLVVDSAASGRLKIERDGLSEEREAKFVLIGTMNPEEGEIRPQLLDRFGLSVSMTAEESPDDRVELMLRREAFEASPSDFRRLWAPVTESLRSQLLSAIERLPGVALSDSVRSLVANLCLERHVAGHRADLVMERAAAALAALEGRLEATEADVLAIAHLALAHRERAAEPPPPPPPPPKERPQEERQKEPQEEPPKDNPEEDKPEEEKPEEEKPEEENQAGPPPQKEDSKEEDSKEENSKEQDQAPQELTDGGDTVFEPGPAFRVAPIQSRLDRLRRRGSGRRSRSRSYQHQGRQVKSGPDQGHGDLAIDATLRAAAPRQSGRVKPQGMAMAIAKDDFREAIRERRLG
ncbi:MAG: ATP-binding protein, partial [Deltaproteobacteria bacterium]|nr:ATP-binding protein [Deltaproteobacteria bacterium]